MNTFYSLTLFNFNFKKYPIIIQARRQDIFLLFFDFLTQKNIFKQWPNAKQEVLLIQHIATKNKPLNLTLEAT